MEKVGKVPIFSMVGECNFFIFFIFSVFFGFGNLQNPLGSAWHDLELFRDRCHQIAIECASMQP